MSSRQQSMRRERGATLLSALVLMLAVLMAGIASTRGAVQAARAAAHERDRMLALQMADAALFDAERDIEGGQAPGGARALALASGQAAAFADGCGGPMPYIGLCSHEPDPARLAATLAADEGPAVLFGTFTGGVMPDGAAGLPAEAPRYLIELMPAASGIHLYRITARGTGAMAQTRAALQAYYRKPAGVQGQRVGWRELGNWNELHAAD